MIIRFHKDLCNTIFKARFEGEDKDGKVVMYKLAKGEQEVIEEKQKNKELPALIAKQKVLCFSGYI